MLPNTEDKSCSWIIYTVSNLYHLESLSRPQKKKKKKKKKDAGETDKYCSLILHKQLLSNVLNPDLPQTTVAFGKTQMWAHEKEWVRSRVTIQGKLTYAGICDR